MLIRIHPDGDDDDDDKEEEEEEQEDNNCLICKPPQVGHCGRDI